MDRLLLRSLLAGLVVLVLTLAATSSAEAKRRTCSGTVSFSGTPTRVVVLRGTTCRTAKSVLRSYDDGTARKPWLCGLAHAPFDRIDGRIVGLSCGYGSGSGDLRSRSHAFVGTVARG